MRKRPSKSSGFTLLELILVLLVLAVIAAVVAPSLRGFTIGRSKSDAATQLIALTGYARTQAISEGRVYRLNFDPSGRSFWLTAQNGGAFQRLSSDYGQPYVLPEGVSRLQTDLPAQADGQFVEFSSSGRTDPPIQIRLTDRGGAMIVVALSSPTELFRILKPEEIR